MKTLQLFLGALVISSLMASMAFAEPVTKPHTFTPGTPAKAGEVNENFDVLYEHANKQVCEGMTEGTKLIGAAAFEVVANSEYLLDVDPNSKSTTPDGTPGTPSWHSHEYDLVSLGRRILHDSTSIVVASLPERARVSVKAPLYLPNNVVEINEFKILVKDNQDQQDVSCKLYQVEFDESIGNVNALLLREVKSTGADEGMRSFTEHNHWRRIQKVDNSKHSFNVRCSWQDDPTVEFADRLRLYGVSISYQVESCPSQ